MHREKKPPPYLGGQGRTGREVRDVGDSILWTLAAGGLMAVVVGGSWAVLKLIEGFFG